MATGGLSYRIWVETGHDLTPSTRNRTRLRQVAVGLIETGSIYLAIQLSYTITVAVAWYQINHDPHKRPSAEFWWAWNVIGAFETMIPVS